MTQPLDEGLWAHTYAAVLGAREAADAYVAGGGWVPRVSRVTIATRSGGWPSLHRPLSAAATDPIDYKDLFHEKVGTIQPIEYSSVPALAEYLRYVSGRNDLRGRLTAPMPGVRDEEWLRIEAVALPLSILARSRALDRESEADIRAIYCERERSWLQEMLPVEYWVPLCLTDVAATTPFRIDDRARIEWMTPEIQEARAPSGYSVAAVPRPVVEAATHALVVGPFDVPNPGPFPRMWIRDVTTLPLAEVDHYFDALRIASNLRTGYAQVLRRPLGWADSWELHLPAMSEAAVLRRYPEGFDDYGWLRTGSSIAEEDLGELPTVSTALRSAGPKTKLAVRRLSLTDLRSRDDDRTVDACIGIEALLGEGRDELTHRMALRAATALASRPENALDATEIYTLVKAVYSHRSSVVHGSANDRDRVVTFRGSEIPAADMAEELLRLLVREFLLRPVPWTPGLLDEHLLTTLTSHGSTRPIPQP